MFKFFDKDLGEGALLMFDTSASVSFACSGGSTSNCTATIGSPTSASRVINNGDFFVNSTDGGNVTSFVSLVQVYSDFTNNRLVYVSFMLTGDYSSALWYHNEYEQEEGFTILHRQVVYQRCSVTDDLIQLTSGVMMFDKTPTIVAGEFPEQCESLGSEYICKPNNM